MSDDALAFDGTCPVCGDEFTAPTDDRIDTNESYDVKMCVLPEDCWDADTPQMLFHMEEL